MCIITFVIKTSINDDEYLCVCVQSYRITPKKESSFYFYLQILLPHEYSVSFKILKYVFSMLIYPMTHEQSFH